MVQDVEVEVDEVGHIVNLLGELLSVCACGVPELTSRKSNNRAKS